MSRVALAAFHRLKVKPANYGTAQYVLYYFAFRHDDKKDGAYPGFRRICGDLDLMNGRVSNAIKHLERKGLIVKLKGQGLRGSTLYQLPWVHLHRLSPDSNEPIWWDATKRSGPSEHSISTESIDSTANGGRADRKKSVGPTRPENSKTSKTADSAFIVAHAAQTVRNRRK